MLPVIAIIGAPNVGKSTLFNRLTRSRDALVADEPGLTRDRHYGIASIGDSRYVLIDTGGMTEDHTEIPGKITQQAELAMDEAHAVVFVVDGRAGVNALDASIASGLRRRKVPVYLAINKSEGRQIEAMDTDFYTLGLGEATPISSAHGDGVRSLFAEVVEAAEKTLGEQLGDDLPEDAGVRVAVIGKPNVGKSTLINRLLGEERLVAHNLPGTTRDAIEVPFEKDGRQYVLVDTAGIRRRSRVDEKIEKFSVIKSLQAIERCNVAVLMIDANEGVTDQDATILQQVEEAGRALVIGINKWDGLQPDVKALVRRQLDLKLAFLDYASIHFISALHGTGVGDVLRAVDKAWISASAKLSTPLLTRLLEDAVARHPPPLVHGRRIKLRYAHQGGMNPPRIILHGNQTEAMPDSYRRYLVGYFRKHLKLHGTPVSIEGRTSDNPFKGRKNVLTERQQRQRKRLLKHVRR
jgi:GTP-binding protein